MTIDFSHNERSSLQIFDCKNKKGMKTSLVGLINLIIILLSWLGDN
jgi:hypothetical protein